MTSDDKPGDGLKAWRAVHARADDAMTFGSGGEHDAIEAALVRESQSTEIEIAAGRTDRPCGLCVAIFADAARLREVVQNVEWSEQLHVVPHCCPICGISKRPNIGVSGEHAPDCKLAAALASDTTAPSGSAFAAYIAEAYAAGFADGRERAAQIAESFASHDECEASRIAASIRGVP